jgi:hypothetical protein
VKKPLVLELLTEMQPAEKLSVLNKKETWEGTRDRNRNMLARHYKAFGRIVQQVHYVCSE